MTLSFESGRMGFNTLTLFVSRGVIVGTNGRFHAQERNDLEDVILNDFASVPTSS